MKVFQVVTERVTGKYPIVDTEDVIKYMTSEDDRLETVAKHAATFCDQYQQTLKSVREILVVTEHVG